MPIAFTSEVPGYYLLSQLYNSDTNSQDPGAIIPRVHSLVINEENRALFTVVAVSEVTYNSELEPVNTTLLSPDPDPLVPGSNDPSEDTMSIIDYGNSRMLLYYDLSENPVKLKPDKKIIILGNDAKEYELVKYDQASDNYIAISMYFDTNGTYIGSKVPLEEIAGTINAKTPTDCHTSISMEDNEVYYLFIFDYAGTQCGSIKLYSRKAVVTNSSNENDVIIGFELEGTQKNALGFYLYQDQDPDDLVMSPKLTYSSGRELNLPIDGMTVHLYGLEGFIPSYPGQQIDILVKYFLTPLQQAAGDFLDTVAGARFLYKEDKITVRAHDTTEFKMKIMTVPKYIVATSSYVLMFFLYRIGEDIVTDITSVVDIDPAFDGQNVNSNQAITLSFRIRDIFPGAIADQIYQQSLLIKLAPPSFYERYIIQDSIGDTYSIYGVDSPILSRPVIYYDTSGEDYRIPTARFANKDVFLEAFYYKNAPLYDAEWMVEPVVPTHFTLRDPATGMVILASPIAIDDYATVFHITGSIPNMLLDGNVIVEFIQEIAGEFNPIYGSPVDVILLP